MDSYLYREHYINVKLNVFVGILYSNRIADITIFIRTLSIVRYQTCITMVTIFLWIYAMIKQSFTFTGTIIITEDRKNYELTEFLKKFKLIKRIFFETILNPKLSPTMAADSRDHKFDV